MNEDALMQLHKVLTEAATGRGCFIRLLLIAGQTEPATKVFIYKEGDHRIPNVHVYYGKEEKICLSISSGKTLAGDMHPTLLSRIQMWIVQHRTELLDRWSKVQKGTKPKLAWASDE
jgi:hypothetical protein